MDSLDLVGDQCESVHRFGLACGYVQYNHKIRSQEDLTIRHYHGSRFDQKFPIYAAAIAEICSDYVPFSVAESFRRANWHKSRIWTLVDL